MTDANTQIEMKSSTGREGKDEPMAKQNDGLVITLHGKAPLKPSIEAMEDLQHSIDYWAGRCIKAENELARLRGHEPGDRPREASTGQEQ
jgi:hypothetical protein